MENNPLETNAKPNNACFFFPLKNDLPAQTDLLGVEPYASAIAQLIFHEQSEPMVIGIQAPWGGGKSTFMGFMERALICGGKTKKPFEKVITVRFNAWQYEDAKQLWAGLASEISSQMEKACPCIPRFFTPFLHAWRNFKRELIITVVLPFIGAIMMGTGLFFAYNDTLFFTKKYAMLVPAGSAVFALAALTWQIFKKITPVSKSILGYIRRPDYKSQMGYQNLVLSDLKFMHACMGKNFKNTKIVVFIDDLDRCSHHKIMETLQAIHLILGNTNFFVILGIDTRMLNLAIETHYFNDKKDKTDALEFAKNYLDKIIHLPIYLPEIAIDNRFPLVESMYRANIQDQIKETVALPNHVASANAELSVYKKFQEHLGNNPRKIKKFVNIHRVIKIMLAHQHHTQTKNQSRKLVIWLLLMDNWPELAPHVLKYAKKDEFSRDCIRDLFDPNENNGHHELTKPYPGIEKFLGLIQGEDCIKPEDLENGGYLESASHFFKLFRTDKKRKEMPD